MSSLTPAQTTAVTKYLTTMFNDRDAVSGILEQSLNSSQNFDMNLKSYFMNSYNSHQLIKAMLRDSSADFLETRYMTGTPTPDKREQLEAYINSIPQTLVPVIGSDMDDVAQIIGDSQALFQCADSVQQVTCPVMNCEPQEGKMPSTFTCYLNMPCTTSGVDQLQGRQLCVFPNTFDVKTTSGVEVQGHVYTNDLNVAGSETSNCCPLDASNPDNFMLQLKQRVGWLPYQPPPSTATPGGQ